MCLTIYYTCPCCGARCGRSTAYSSHDGDCPGAVWRERVMQAEHFFDWFCATQYCPYSKSSQIVAKAEEKSILRAQAAGKAAVDLGAEGTKGADLANGDANEASSATDWDDEMELKNEDDEADPHPRANGHVQYNRNKKADNTLAALGPDITKQVDELLIQVASDTAGDGSKRWYKAEEELLWLLRAHKVTHYTISTVFLKRHSYNACESRITLLNKRG